MPSTQRSTSPPPAGAAPPRGRIGGLDGLRAIAVAVVLVYHLMPGLLPGGMVGVDAFFVISGFLITGSRMRADAGPYLINRVTRIFPGFLFSLVFVAAMNAWLARSRG